MLLGAFLSPSDTSFLLPLDELSIRTVPSLHRMGLSSCLIGEFERLIGVPTRLSGPPNEARSWYLFLSKLVGVGDAASMIRPKKDV